jgi:hypothetical protein
LIKRVHALLQPLRAGSADGLEAERKAVGLDLARRIGAFLDRNAFVIVALAGAGVLQLSFAMLAVTPDAWYTLLGGRIVSRSWLPHHEVLTILGHGRVWVDQQWLAHVMLYGLWAAGRWPLALTALAAMSVTAFGLAAATARILGATARSTALLLLPCFLVGFVNTSFRAQTLTYILFALILLLLLRDEARPGREVFLVFPLLVLWANMHGSVVLGAGLVVLRGLVLAVSKLRARERVSAWMPRAAALVVLPWLCTLASPYGLALPGYYRRLLDNPTLGRLVTEWGPTTIRNDPFYYALLAGALWLAFRRAQAMTPLARLALLTSALAGLWTLRNMVWFCLVAAAVLPLALDAAWKPRPAESRRPINLALVAAAG